MEVLLGNMKVVLEILVLSLKDTRQHDCSFLQLSSIPVCEGRHELNVENNRTVVLPSEYKEGRGRGTR